MVMTMGLLGREEGRKLAHLGFIHILGATIGGAIVGGLFGIIGQLFLLQIWRKELILMVTIFALLQSVTKLPTRLGIQKQVPRTWIHTMPPGLCYLLWGMLLGSGIATVIPYSAFLILLTTQLTSGVILGCLSGALFGSVRQLVALLPLSQKQYRLCPERAGMLMPTLTRPVSLLNSLLILGGGSILLLTAWR